MTKFMIKIIAIVTVVSIALILFTYRPCQEVSSSPPTLADLHDIQELQTLFNQDEGTPRLILLLSPT